ncbi:MAG TPA: hypothetical protein VJK52_04620 [Candidatus Nanoarchaeia archaeon]|nr:hypothetical protein [Candidatus Nanoarchaeia archaeon]
MPTVKEVAHVLYEIDPAGLRDTTPDSALIDYSLDAQFLLEELQREIHDSCSIADITHIVEEHMYGPFPGSIDFHLEGRSDAVATRLHALCMNGRNPEMVESASR